ncbi:MAG: DinB family protein, partial [Candidatus Hydrogenedentota bacterium]
GPAWHGPSLLASLANVDHIRASARPLSDAHSIWEIVLHAIAWQAYTLNVLDGGDATGLEGDADWPPVLSAEPEDWASTLERLHTTADRLQARLADLPDARLDTMIPGRDFVFKVLVHGIAHHNIYHAGQISLLAKS